MKELLIVEVSEVQGAGSGDIVHNFVSWVAKHLR